MIALLSSVLVPLGANAMSNLGGNGLFLPIPNHLIGPSYSNSTSISSSNNSYNNSYNNIYVTRIVTQTQVTIKISICQKTQLQALIFLKI